MKKILLICALILSAWVEISADNFFSVNGINYYHPTDGTSVSVQRGDYYGNIVIPSSVTYNGNSYSVTTIGYEAFACRSGLTSVTIPNSVTEIGGYAFNCSGLTSITISNSVTEIGKFAFMGSRIKEVKFESFETFLKYKKDFDNIEHLYIGDYTNEIKNLVIPNSMTRIPSSAFSGCSGLTSVTIPNSVTEIGEGAFSNCSGLTSITIPSSVTSCHPNSFYSQGLRDLYVMSQYPPECCDREELSKDMKTRVKLHVPASSYDRYLHHPVWGKFYMIEGTTSFPGASKSKHSTSSKKKRSRK